MIFGEPGAELREDAIEVLGHQAATFQPTPFLKDGAQSGCFVRAVDVAALLDLSGDKVLSLRGAFVVSDENGKAQEDAAFLALVFFSRHLEPLAQALLGGVQAPGIALDLG
jgi:hypothetical protein